MGFLAVAETTEGVIYLGQGPSFERSDRSQACGVEQLVEWSSFRRSPKPGESPPGSQRPLKKIVPWTLEVKDQTKNGL